MGLVTFTCGYKPCSRAVTYAYTFPGAKRRYCSHGCYVKNKRRRMAVKSISALKERSVAFRKEGLCPSCGAEPGEGYVYCYEHRRYFRTYQRERRATQREALCPVRPIRDDL